MRDFLEIVYFIFGGPVLVIIAAIGLRQLRITKDVSKMNAKRESYKLASEQCNYYLTQIIPIATNFDRAVDKHNVSFYAKSQVLVKGETVQVKFDEQSLKDDEAQRVSSEFVALANSLEGFAVLFVSGVADEGVAFSSVGYTYCNTVRKLLPELVLIDAGKRYFVNLLKLFFLWNSRNEEQMLKSQAADIENKLKSVNGKIIHPLGTS